MCLCIFIESTVFDDVNKFKATFTDQKLGSTWCSPQRPPQWAQPASASIRASSSSSWTGRSPSRFLQQQTGHKLLASATKKSLSYPGVFVLLTSAENMERKWSEEMTKQPVSSRASWMSKIIMSLFFLIVIEDKKTHLSTVVYQNREGAKTEDSKSTNQFGPTLRPEGAGILKGQRLGKKLILLHHCRPGGRSTQKPQRQEVREWRTCVGEQHPPRRSKHLYFPQLLLRSYEYLYKTCFFWGRWSVYSSTQFETCRKKNSFSYLPRTDEASRGVVTFHKSKSC